MRNYKKKLLTILICCYNAAEFLNECLNSLKQQDVPDFYKILFIDDASCDNSFKIAKGYSGQLKDLSLMKNKNNLGLSKCCNKALRIINTPYFMRLDADDYLSGDALKKILPELSYCDRKDFIVFSRYDAHGKKIIKIKVDNDIYTWISGGTIFNTQAVISVGGYSKEYWEEYDLYIKLLQQGFKYRVSPCAIYHYRRGHNGSMTQNYKQNKKGWESLLRKHSFALLRKYGNTGNLIKYYRVNKLKE